MKQYSIFYFNIRCRKKLHTVISLGLTNKSSTPYNTEQLLTTDTPVQPKCIESAYGMIVTINNSYYSHQSDIY